MSKVSLLEAGNLTLKDLEKAKIAMMFHSDRPDVCVKRLWIAKETKRLQKEELLKQVTRQKNSKIAISSTDSILLNKEQES